jgi:hypothetical protein
MLTQAPVFHHLNLHGYWLAKRADRILPARRDIDPADIPLLLPYLKIVERTGDRFRYRLVGSAIVRETGYDFTGSFVGSTVSASTEAAAKLIAAYDRAFARRHPIFVTGMFHLPSGDAHNMSLLILPLSDDGLKANMAVATLIARFHRGLKTSRDWLRGLPLEIYDAVDVHGASALERLCLEWEQRCSLEPVHATIT